MKLGQFDESVTKIGVGLQAAARHIDEILPQYLLTKKVLQKLQEEERKKKR